MENVTNDYLESKDIDPRLSGDNYDPDGDIIPEGFVCIYDSTKDDTRTLVSDDSKYREGLGHATRR